MSYVCPDSDLGPLFARISDPPTSQQSSAEVSTRVNRLRQMFLDALGSESLTANEVARRATCDHALHESIRKRAGELVNAKQVHVVGSRKCTVTGSNANVYRRAT